MEFNSGFKGLNFALRSTLTSIGAV